jgi:Mrp family chromosome partitioning ATPase
MTRMLEELKQHADVVLIDTPPALSFAESRALAGVVDGVVFVVAAGQALRGVEQEAKQQLERAQARLLGMVVNKVIPEEDDGYYFYEKHNSRADKPKPKPLPATATAAFLLIILLAGVDGVLSRYSVSMPGWLSQSSHVVTSWVAKRF